MITLDIKVNMTRSNFFFTSICISLLLIAGTVSAAHITITDVNVKVGGTTTATIILDESPPFGISGYGIDLAISDPTKAQITGVTFNTALAGLTDSRQTPFSKGDISWADINEVLQKTAYDTELARLTITGLDTGSTTLSASLNDLTGDGGELLIPISTIDSPVITVTDSVQQGINPVSLPGYNLPRDSDSDGFCEDINGDGSLDFSDISVYFYSFDWIQENEPAPLFDFNRNGIIDFGDIIRLNQKL